MGIKNDALKGNLLGHRFEGHPKKMLPGLVDGRHRSGSTVFTKRGKHNIDVPEDFEVLSGSKRFQTVSFNISKGDFDALKCNLGGIHKRVRQSRMMQTVMLSGTKLFSL